MNAQHTPGPWLTGYGDAVGMGEVYGVGLDTEPDWTPVCILSLSKDVNEIDEANARLIAAAPELIEIVNRFVSDGISTSLVKDARAVIAKATIGAA